MKGIRDARSLIPAVCVASAALLTGCFLCPHPPDGYVEVHRMAIDGKKDDVIQDLKQRPADLNLADEHGLTPLHLAVQHCADDSNRDRIDLVLFLLKTGANPNLKASGGSTPLHFAAQVGNAEMIKALIRAGARIDTKDDHEKIPLQRAIDSGNEAVFRAAMATP
jgi:ankyrin repeat protein